MTKVAVISDIHGNLPALEAVLVEITSEGFELIVSDEDVVTLLSPKSRIEAMLEGIEHPIVIGGHVHHQFTTEVGGKQWIDAGSVGMPYEGAPGAYWLTIDNAGPMHRRTEYDLVDALLRIAENGYPSFDELARTLRGAISADDAASAFEPEA